MNKKKQKDIGEFIGYTIAAGFYAAIGVVNIFIVWLMFSVHLKASMNLTVIFTATSVINVWIPFMLAYHCIGKSIAKR